MKKRNANSKLVFKEVHGLLRQSKFQLALDKLVEHNTGRLAFEFRKYANHGWYLIGDAYLKMEDHQAAIVAFKKSFAYDQTDPDALLAIGYCLSEIGQPGKAKKVLEKGVRLFRRDIRIRYNLANACFDLGQLDLALPLYRSLSKVQNPEIRRMTKSNIVTVKKKR